MAAIKEWPQIYIPISNLHGCYISLPASIQRNVSSMLIDCINLSAQAPVGHIEFWSPGAF